MEQKNPQDIYLAPRDEGFVIMIKNILKQGKLKEKYIDLLTDEESLAVYHKVFTHPSVDSENNYEYFEILGDSTVNKCIVWYLPRRFSQLASPDGVPVIARLKIHLVSKTSLSSLTQGFDMWKYVSADKDTRETKMKKTLEDIFEAFIGATETLIDSRIRRCAGYDICYNIMESLLDKINISLKYEDLFDPKTRLKEIFDYFAKQGIGRLEYTAERLDKLSSVRVFRVVGPSKQLIGEGKAALKQDAEQVASNVAIDTMRRLGFSKPVPEIYRKFI